MINTPISRMTVLFVGILLAGCSKTSFTSRPLASLQVVHALMDPVALKLNSNERDSVKNYSAKVFGLALKDGNGMVGMYSSTNPAKPLYNAQFDMQDGDTYSLFLYGSLGNPQALWLREVVPARYNDSVVGIRLAHLAAGVSTVELRLGAGGGTTLLSAVGHGAVSEIVKVPLPQSIPPGGTRFEVWELESSTLLATYTLPTNVNPLYPGISVALQRFKNVTLVLRGAKDSTMLHAPAIFPIPLSY